MKFLIIRFSSIGDIVLTTPVIRALANADAQHEIHFITKSKFASVLEHNPYIHKLITFEKEITEVEDIMRQEDYDYIIDLHSNLRSKRLRSKLQKPTLTFNKLNYEKWLRVNFKWDILPPVHIVDRYMDTLTFLGLQYDGLGLDYFVGEADENHFVTLVLQPNLYHVMVVGGAHFTKQIPVEMLIEIGKSTSKKWILLGGKEDASKAQQIAMALGINCIDLTSKLSLNQSATVVKYAHKILTPDTGLMHIAAAFKKEIISVWGNTIPQFGMNALLPEHCINIAHIFEVEKLNCRPCSKIGYKKCPKKHFNCMQMQNVNAIVKELEK